MFIAKSNDLCLIEWTGFYAVK